MLNAGSILNKTKQLTDLANQKNLDIIGVPRFRVSQHSSLLDLIFVKFPHLISPFSIRPPLGKSDHAVLCWTYTSALPQLPPRPEKINPARINVQKIATLALACRWEFPEEFSLDELRTSFRGQISLLTSKATPPPKAYKRHLHKAYYKRRVKREIQRRRQAWTAWKN